MPLEIFIHLDFTIASKRIVRVIPINPELIQVDTGTIINIADLVNANQITQIGARKLRRIEWTSIFNAEADIYPNVGKRENSRFIAPHEWINLIELSLRKPIIFHLSVVDLTKGISAINFTTGFSYKCVIESFEWRYVGGWGKDIQYRLVLREYRATRIRSALVEQIEPLPFVGKKLRDEQPKPEQINKEQESLKGFEEIAREYDMPVELLKAVNKFIEYKISGNSVLDQIQKANIRLYTTTLIETGLKDKDTILQQLVRELSKDNNFLRALSFEELTKLRGNIRVAPTPALTFKFPD